MSGDIIDILKYNTNNLNLVLIISGVLFFYFLYIQEEFFFNKTRDKMCVHYNGHCSMCKCWSCKKYQIDYERKDNER